MIGWLQLTEAQKRTSLEQASIRSGISAKAIEKDWWVTLCLKALFKTPHSKYLIFKGGTSLSKGWKLIERFSEDIDISLDPEAFGKEYKKEPSHSYVKMLKREGCKFTSTVVKAELEQALTQVGVAEGTVAIEAAPVPETIPDRDPQTLFVRYVSLYDPNPYLSDEVKIEVGVRSLKEPFGSISVQSILSEVFPNDAYAESPFEVITVEPRKTFLEKAFLLHEKFLQPDQAKIIGDRQSRHLYDLVRMMNTEAGHAALSDAELYVHILEHRRNYIRLAGIDYETLHHSTLSFVPPVEWLSDFEQDYRVMQREMIYGEAPDFEDLISELRILTGRFRLIGHKRKLEELIEQATKDLDNRTITSVERIVVEIPVNTDNDIYQEKNAGDKSLTYVLKFNRIKKKLIFQEIVIREN